MTNYLIDSVTGYIAWMILIFIVVIIHKLFKKENLKTINFKMVFLVSLIGIIPSTFNYLTNNGDKNIESQEEITEEDKLILEKILRECLSGEDINIQTHKEFWSLVEKNKLTKTDIEEMFILFNNQDLVVLQKYFWEDALRTIKTSKICESQERLNLEQKLLNNSQKERNKEYLQKIHSNTPMDINGEMTVINEEDCQGMIDNLDHIWLVGKRNIELLKNKDSFK
jgi:hypothetical protein